MEIASKIFLNQHNHFLEEESPKNNYLEEWIKTSRISKSIFSLHNISDDLLNFHILPLLEVSICGDCHDMEKIYSPWYGSIK